MADQGDGHFAGEAGGSMSRSDRLELERRIDQITELLVSRVSYRAICEHAKRRWGISERQTARYVTAARERIVAAFQETREEKLARAHAGYEALYVKQLAGGRHAEARRTLDSLVRLVALDGQNRSGSEGEAAEQLRVVVEYVENDPPADP
jgi:hypothetical protein